MPYIPSHFGRLRRRGFTLIEALVSITVAVLASSALFLGLYGNLYSTRSTVEQLIARGIAEQVVDEVLGTRYGDGSPYDPLQWPFAANAVEQAGAGRSLYNDTDDYHGFSAKPPKDVYGVSLGQENGSGGTRHPNFVIDADTIKRWKQEIKISYVNESDPTLEVTSSPYSYLRAVEVTISADEGGGVLRPLAKVRRVYGYVPAPTTGS